jgi:hypothetical protein
MSLSLQAVVVLAAVLFMPTLCSAQAGMGEPPPLLHAQTSNWEMSATGYYYALDNQSDYFSAIATADRDALHLEARYNYEALDSGSLFAGWSFSGGDELTWELTPIIGVVFGSTHGIAPGFEASVAYGIVDFYTEAEYMHDFDALEDSFTYAWSELGISPLPWLRFGLVGQRSKAYESDRDIQRGGFAQLTFGKLTLGAYVFNPDVSADRFAIFSLGASF